MYIHHGGGGGDGGGGRRSGVLRRADAAAAALARLFRGLLPRIGRVVSARPLWGPPLALEVAA